MTRRFCLLLLALGCALLGAGPARADDFFQGKQITLMTGGPSLLTLVKNDVHRQVLEPLFARNEMGRPFVLPPGVPAERVALLRKAFVDAAKDPEFLSEAQRLGFEVDAVDGETMQKLMQQLYARPKVIYDEAKRVIKIAVENR